MKEGQASAPSCVGLVLVVPLAAFVAVSACDPRVQLAQSPVFEGLRGDLIEQCCACLAQRGTRAPGASCAEAVLSPDGGIVLPDDAVVAADDPGDPFVADDLDDSVDRGEIPCGCGLDEGSCIGRLESGERMAVPGACIDQPNNFWSAPCESACGGVLIFDPVPVAQ